MLVEQRLQQPGALAAARVPPKERHGLAGMGIDGADARVFGGLGRQLNHHRLALRTPPGAQRWQPTQGDLVGGIEMVAGLETVAGVFDHLAFTAYAGSGRRIVWCGRLSTTPAAFRCRRTVS